MDSRLNERKTLLIKILSDVSYFDFPFDFNFYGRSECGSSRASSAYAPTLALQRGEDCLSYDELPSEALEIEIKKPAEFLSAGFYESAIYSATTSSTTFAETLE